MNVGPTTTIADKPTQKTEGNFIAKKTRSIMQIDGRDDEAIWSALNWYDMNYLWMGEPVDSTDYYGKFKLAWDSQYLYILVDIIDENLHPTLADGLENYWKGDYVEVFVDEDVSGGNHQYNHQAFAYHVSTDGHVIDKSTKEKTIYLDNHVDVARSKKGNEHLWELAIKLYSEEYDETSNANKPQTIFENKTIGFSIAYGDNDGTQRRENLMGSKQHHGNNNDEGYVNSDVFGRILFSN